MARLSHVSARNRYYQKHREEIIKKANKYVKRNKQKVKDMQNKYRRELVKAAIELGHCPNCFRFKENNNKYLCEKCRIRQNLYLKKRKAKATSAGLCSYCFKRKVKQGRVCAVCLKRLKDWRERKKEAGK